MRDRGSARLPAQQEGQRPRADYVTTYVQRTVGTGSRQVVDFHDRAGSRGAVLSRVVFTSVKDPRLRLVATNENGRRCFIALDPPNVTTDAPLTLKGLGELSALRGL
jgi:hypothetical protein